VDPQIHLPGRRALLSAEALHDTITRHTGLPLARPLLLRPALRRDPAPLAGQLRARSADIARLGFDETFRRNVVVSTWRIPSQDFAHRMPSTSARSAWRSRSAEPSRNPVTIWLPPR
jgi:hypothetical protein